MKRMLAAAFAMALLPFAAEAQSYPDHTITVVVPFAAGGPTDTVARLVAESMSRELGQQVIVENVGGAGGTLGAGRVAKAEPDGYTLLLHHIGQATSATLYRSLPYNPREDFAPIGLITDVPMTVIARADLEPADGKALVEYIKANGDKISYGNAGIGSASHLCGMLLMDALKVQMTTIPYKGTGPAMTDLLGGQIDLLCDQTTNTTSHIKAGKVKAYAVTTPARVASLPDIPTTAEAGMAGVEVAVWHALYGPKGTPQEAIDKLSAALKVALKDPKVIERFAELGTEPVAEDRATPEALAAYLPAEIDRWKPIIDAAGIYAD
ncbi:tripartite tricarboxylate transporter substrate-binding protein [Dongia sp.]|uniref:tripartite tricarboxylate transporter substrate-binding protein n=1 Tax=Dongia sp. TaxID=1977262 RepID=UPI0035B16185